MNRVYESYKSLRNLLRKLNLELSLVDLWQLSLQFTNNGNLLNRPDQYLLPWDLPIIAREIVLNSDLVARKRLNSPGVTQKVINSIRVTAEMASKIRMDNNDVMMELHRLSHRQFISQQDESRNSLTRYLKVYGYPEVGAILQRKTGFSIHEYFLLGLWLTSHLQKRFDINACEDFTVLGIAREKSQDFFLKLSLSIEELKEEIFSQQKYDETWEYTWNPLEGKPLISLNPSNRYYLYCPVPDLLLRRFSYGIFYELVGESGFDNAYGASFEKYIGEILNAVFPPHHGFSVHAEEKYMVGGQVHHGADWILSGEDANLFIECKTKRMRQDAKVAIKEDVLESDIGVVAAAIVQLYKNIQEAEEGKSTWIPNGLPNFPLVITLEDWLFFGPVPNEILSAEVTKRMAPAGLDSSLIKLMPYNVMSSRQFEKLSGVIENVGIRAFFQGKESLQYRHWMWPEYAREEFPGAPRINLFNLFMHDWECILPREVM